VNRIVAHLLSPLEEGQRIESSYDALLAAWAAWFIEEWHVDSRDAITTIVRAMTGAEEGVGARKAYVSSTPCWITLLIPP
jgi:hypothetical protein